jgi:hypothetical protein
MKEYAYKSYNQTRRELIYIKALLVTWRHTSPELLNAYRLYSEILQMVSTRLEQNDVIMLLNNAHDISSLLTEGGNSRDLPFKKWALDETARNLKSNVLMLLEMLSVD